MKDNHIAKTLKRLRIEQGYVSAESFAIKNGLNANTYRKYEKGEDLMKVNTLLKIAEALDLNGSQFFFQVEMDNLII